jgi:RNA polymerase sigma factor (sigma-70 family)
MLEDKLLILRFKRGDCDALRQIYDKYKGDLLKLAIFLTGDINRSEDVVQDVFVKLAQSYDRIGIRSNLRNYLITCIVNRIRTLRRDHQRHEEKERAQPAMRITTPIGGLVAFYQTLVQGKKDPAYYGKFVTPKDADLVLMRWKVSDTEYRVIFGDHHAETVTAEALKELEKKLPN